MQARNQAIIPLTRLDIQRMVFESVKMLCVPLDEDKRPNGYWDEETCREEAKKYKSRTEFSNNSPRAYEVARKNGWLSNYNWLERPVAHNKKWNRDTCYDEAKKYKSSSEFQKNNGSAYGVARKNGWIKDYTWFNNIKRKPIGYWNRKTCYKEAQKYRSKKDLERNNPTAYQVARKNGWLNDYTWFEKRAISENNIYIAYYYEDKDTNAVYVGLTNNLKRRHKEHKTGTNLHGKPIRDTVYEYFKSIGKEVPEPIVLHKGIYAKDAQEYEKKYVDQFKNEGKLVLNIANAGSLGGLGKWTKEKCFDEAKKYKSRKEFDTKAHGAYMVALKNGWLDDYDWFKNPLKKWDYDACYNEAKKYSSKIEFFRNSNSAYQIASRNGWLDDYTWFEQKRKQKGYWNRETCYEEAKKYKSRNEFFKGSRGAYKVSLKNGWLDDYTWMTKPSRSNQAAL